MLVIQTLHGEERDYLHRPCWKSRAAKEAITKLLSTDQVHQTGYKIIAIILDQYHLEKEKNMFCILVLLSLFPSFPSYADRMDFDIK